MPPTYYIRFDTSGAFATAATINLTAIGDTTVGVGPSALAVTGDVEIEGPVLPGGGVTISANDLSADNLDEELPAMRLFYVAQGADLTLTDLTLTGGVAEGADGKANTAGAAGQGGAVYNQGSLELNGHCTLSGLHRSAGNQANGFTAARIFTALGGDSLAQQLHHLAANTAGISGGAIEAQGDHRDELVGRKHVIRQLQDRRHRRRRPASTIL